MSGQAPLETAGNPGHIRISLSVAHQLPWQRLYL
jgi:hypothetical protein